MTGAAHRAKQPEGPKSDRVRKVSISMPETLIKEVRERVGSGSVSAYVTKAVQRQLERDNLADLIAEFETEHGPIPHEALDRAEERLCELEKKWAEEGL